MIFWGCLVFSRDFGRPKRAKFKIYLIFEDCRASVVALSLGRWWCPLVQAVQGAGASGVQRCVFRPFIPAFCPLSCLAPAALCLNMPLFRILRGFLAWFGVVGLVVCVACMVFVRV